MTATEYIECINRVFGNKYPGKGHFVVIEQYVNDTPLPILKHYVMSLYHIPTKEKVLTISMKDRVTNDRKPAFEKKALMEFICRVTENMDKIYGFGVQ